MVGADTRLRQHLRQLLRGHLVVAGKACEGRIDIVGADRHFHAADFLALQRLIDKLLTRFFIEITGLALQLQEGDALGDIVIGDGGLVDDNLDGAVGEGLAGIGHNGHGNGEYRKGESSATQSRLSEIHHILLPFVEQGPVALSRQSVLPDEGIIELSRFSDLHLCIRTANLPRIYHRDPQDGNVSVC